tara:strand:+ start:4320 stop:4613 length:294 start_codon:yes stop_codon:yes gene_type:complete
MATKTTAKASTTKTTAKAKVEYIKVIAERRQFTTHGKKTSKPCEQNFLPSEWESFKTHGKDQGWFVNEIIEHPLNVNLSYENPDGTGFDKEGKPLQA